MLDRRMFLMGATSATGLLATPALAWGRQKLVLHRPRTMETVTAEFRPGRISKKAQASLSWLLRDVKAREAKDIDPELLLLAARLSEQLEVAQLNVLSGYRTARTNAGLRGAARKSFHMKAQAVDIRVPGVKAREIAEAARSLGAGGVGHYVVRGFVHMDTGPRRDWRR